MVSLADSEENWQSGRDDSANNLIFIDTNLTNYQSLIPDGNDHQVVLINSQENGIEQITNVLEQYSNLASISIFSHGDEGTIQLGDTYLSDANLDAYQSDLAAWGNALSPEGDLLLYGCNVGANNAGLDFVKQVSSLTGADVAASNDLTGNFDLGGDWTLEVVTGNVETQTFVLTEYGSLLDLRFNFTYDDNVTTEQKTAFEFAGKAWSSVLSDDVTVNIHVSMVNNSDLPNNTLGGAVPFFYQGTNYEKFKESLQQDNSSEDDNLALQNLNTGLTTQVKMTEAGDDDTVTLNMDKVAMTRANAKALGFIDANDATLDGTIVMNNLVGTGASWQYDYFSDGVGNKIDFTTVAMHEIGHTLGFVSVIDGLNRSNVGDSSLVKDSFTSFDLFRFSSGGGDDDDGGNQLNNSIRVTSSVFAIDNSNPLARLAQGTEKIGEDDRIDGYQASHWKNEDNAGIMDPLLELGVRREITELDLRAMDVIGWDRNVISDTSTTDTSNTDTSTTDTSTTNTSTTNTSTTNTSTTNTSTTNTDTSTTNTSTTDTSWIQKMKDLWSQAVEESLTIGNINRNVEVGQMLKDWRWARRGSSTTLGQSGNIAQFLAQEGFFSVGAFRESFDFSTVNGKGESNYLTTVDNSSDVPVLEFNHDSNGEGFQNNPLSVEIQNLVQENEGVDYEEILALITEELSEDELSQLSLEDLSQLVEQQLEESLV